MLREIWSIAGRFPCKAVNVLIFAQRSQKQIGYSWEGADEIKRHPFFRGVNWALVRCMVRSLTFRGMKYN